MKLIETIQSLCPNLFAVVDSALVSDFTSRCDQVGLGFRHLYSGEFAQVGPLLVALPDRPAIDRIANALPDGVEAVFWAWTAGEDELYRHLRRLGKVEIPHDGVDSEDTGFQAAVFRHGDPASLIQILPVLKPTQRETFFAGSPGIVFAYRDRRGRNEIVRARSDGRILRELRRDDATEDLAPPESP